jgi:hypothetical protein
MLTALAVFLGAEVLATPRAHISALKNMRAAVGLQSRSVIG